MLLAALSACANALDARSSCLSALGHFSPTSTAVSSGPQTNQVQALFLLQAHRRPANQVEDAFPGEAEILSDRLKRIGIRALRELPNLKVVFVSNRMYAGYSDPEMFGLRAGPEAARTTRRRRSKASAESGCAGSWAGAPSIRRSSATPCCWRILIPACARTRLFSRHIATATMVGFSKHVSMLSARDGALIGSTQNQRRWPTTTGRFSTFT